jgi:hypothetical protein
MKEQDCHCDKGGDRGSNYGLGKMNATPGGFGQGHIKKGHKKLGTVNVQQSGYAPPTNKKETGTEST